MYQLILMLHVLIAIAIIALVLMQHGKGADIGAAFGSGASSTLFGSQGTGGFLFKVTGGLVIVFFSTSLMLSSMVANQYRKAAQQAIPQQPSMPVNTIPVPVENSTGGTK